MSICYNTPNILCVLKSIFMQTAPLHSSSADELDINYAAAVANKSTLQTSCDRCGVDT